MTCTLPLKYNQTQKSTTYHTHKTFFQRRQQTFTEKEFYAKTDRYYYEARYLDPRTSRWLGVDPAMSEYVDPDGKWVNIVIGAAVGANIPVIEIKP